MVLLVDVSGIRVGDFITISGGDNTEAKRVIFVGIARGLSDLSSSQRLVGGGSVTVSTNFIHTYEAGAIVAKVTDLGTTQAQTSTVHHTHAPSTSTTTTASRRSPASSETVPTELKLPQPLAGVVAAIAPDSQLPIWKIALGGFFFGGSIPMLCLCFKMQQTRITADATSPRSAEMTKGLMSAFDAPARDLPVEHVDDELARRRRISGMVQSKPAEAWECPAAVGKSSSASGAGRNSDMEEFASVPHRVSAFMAADEELGLSHS